MIQFGNMETAIADIQKVMQSYPNAVGVAIIKTPDTKGWMIQYRIAKRESGFISKWWDW